MATNALTLTTGALDNSNGVIFAGDVNNPTAATGDVTVNVTGADDSFSNTSGQILGQNSVTLKLPQQTVDPSSAIFGTVNGGNALNLSVAAITNSGTWTLPGTNVTVSASQGITNAGTIGQAAGSLALNGAVTNSGTIAAQDFTVKGNLANQAGATVQASDAFMLNGSGTNAGTIEALNNLTISGTGYDNSNGTTKAGTGSAGSGNMAINLSGDLTNVTGIQAGAQTVIEGGSFLTNLRDDAVRNVAASANYAIGNLFGPTGADPNMLGSIASHAVLGCAAGAASGEGCGGGAVGGAVSAALSPGFVSAMDPSGADLNQGQQAVLAAFATAMGGSAAVLTGTNVQGAISAAQSEALNNAGGPGHIKLLGDLGTNGGEPGTGLEAEKDTVSILPSNQAGGGGVGGATAEAQTTGDGSLLTGTAAVCLCCHKQRAQFSGV
jgi:filamentous hemagglutinin